MKKIGLLLTVAIAILGYLQSGDFSALEVDQPQYSASSAIQEAFSDKRSDVQVSGTGVVVSTLKDDTVGSRHQKFILKLESGQTVLISHNIDLAPRINSLRKGDRVEFYGEYEWNSKGGVVHWTHHDPRGNHVDGWLKHDGVVYQ